MRLQIRRVLLAFSLPFFTLCAALAAHAAPAADISIVFSCDALDSMYVSATSGIHRALTELGVPSRIYTCDYNEKNFRSAIETAAKHSKLVIAVGGDLGAIVDRTAPLYKKTDFVLVDARSSHHSVTSVLFRQNEGSYLAGALAAMTAERSAALLGVTPAVGIILGERGKENPAMLDFLVGFEQGVRAVSKDMPVLKRSVQSWNDPRRAKLIAVKMNKEGALIIYQAAGRSGAGVIEAGIENSFCVIGVDEPQERIAPGVVLTAMLKHFDKALFETIAAKREGRLERGAVLIYDLDNSGVGLSWTSNTLIPEDVKNRLDQLSSQIGSGRITVDSAFDEEGAVRPDLEPLDERKKMK